MPSAHREAVRDFATASPDTRMDISGQVVERRKMLGLTQMQLAEKARVTEMNLHLLEQGQVFEEGHNTACAVLNTLARMEDEQEGRPFFTLAQIAKRAARNN